MRCRKSTHTVGEFPIHCHEAVVPKLWYAYHWCYTKAFKVVHQHTYLLFFFTKKTALTVCALRLLTGSMNKFLHFCVLALLALKNGHKCMARGCRGCGRIPNTEKLATIWAKIFKIWAKCTAIFTCKWGTVYFPTKAK